MNKRKGENGTKGRRPKGLKSNRKTIIHPLPLSGLSPLRRADNTAGERVDDANGKVKTEKYFTDEKSNFNTFSSVEQVANITHKFL